jgi:hypothetical protein
LPQNGSAKKLTDRKTKLLRLLFRAHLIIIEVVMADRKQFQNVTAPDPELINLLEASRNRLVTEDELHEQRISFAFGNAPDSELITKDSVRLASENIRLLRSITPNG